MLAVVRHFMELPFKIAELDHVVLRCRNQTAMLDFYTRVLGLTEERRLAALGLIQLRAGASMVDLAPANGVRVESALNVDHFCLGVEVSDLAALAAYLKKQGVVVLDTPVQRYGARGFGLSIYIHDPEGNTVELKQIPSSADA
jgi:glyoxylase I family protein